ncbi:MAG TPA: hypothetical protein VI461_02025 [Chitinophagaceae bacterium]|nr:hypothetical protein [Chitinophagaceae bacterium]
MTEERMNELRKAVGNFTRDEIIEICLLEIEKEGYVILDDRFEATHKQNVETAIPLITKGGKYFLDQTPFQKKWIIYPTPGYKKPTIWRKYQILEKLVISIIVGLISLAVGLTISKESKQSQVLIDKQQDSAIVDIKNHLRNLQIHVDTLK